jgi:hypothetical protein
MTQIEQASATLCQKRDRKTSKCDTPATERTGPLQETHKVYDPVHKIPPLDLILN